MTKEEWIKQSNIKKKLNKELKHLFKLRDKLLKRDQELLSKIADINKKLKDQEKLMEKPFNII